MTLYKMQCGCIIKAEELKWARKNGKGLRKRCPEHLGHIINRINQCVDCGCDIEFKPTGHKKERCGPCRKIHHTKMNRERYRPAAKIRKEKAVVLKLKYPTPIRVWSVEEAARKNIPCIPLQKLFERRVAV